MPAALLPYIYISVATFVFIKLFHLMSTVFSISRVYYSCFAAIDTTVSVFRSLYMKKNADYSLRFLNVAIDTSHTSRLVLDTASGTSTQCPFWFCFSISTLQKLQICVLFRGVSSSNCPKFTEILYALFH